MLIHVPLSIDSIFHAKKIAHSLNSSVVLEDTMSYLASTPLYLTYCISERCSYIVHCLSIYIVDTMGIDFSLSAVSPAIPA